ncbi:hypothetical protein EDB89DRAFT_2248533 [Lactarius sanguifluus]|nr:hypothetical protein EDB89DRAFT_2248533 [Lactarius sanguifluus]
MTTTVTAVVVIATVGGTSSPLYHFPASNPMKKKSTYRPIPSTSAKEDDNIMLPSPPLPSGQRELYDDGDGSRHSANAADGDYDTRAAATITEQGKDDGRTTTTQTDSSDSTTAGAVVLQWAIP